MVHQELVELRGLQELVGHQVQVELQELMARQEQVELRGLQELVVRRVQVEQVVLQGLPVLQELVGHQVQAEQVVLQGLPVLQELADFQVIYIEQHQILHYQFKQVVQVLL